MNVKSKIEQLRQQIHEANVAYHTHDQPLISDFNYDIFIKGIDSIREGSSRVF
jgi:DNA ligase (NAD+)